MAKKDKESKAVKSPEQIEEEAVVASVNAALAEHGYGLMPYLVYNEMGVWPAVKPVKQHKKESLDAKVDTNESGKSTGAQR